MHFCATKFTYFKSVIFNIHLLLNQNNMPSSCKIPDNVYISHLFLINIFINFTRIFVKVSYLSNSTAFIQVNNKQYLCVLIVSTISCITLPIHVYLFVQLTLQPSPVIYVEEQHTFRRTLYHSKSFHFWITCKAAINDCSLSIPSQLLLLLLFSRVFYNQITLFTVVRLWFATLVHFDRV